MGAVARGIENIEFPCGVPQMLKGGVFLSRPAAALTFTRSANRWAWLPVSPPLNFPDMVPLWMFPIALACGNTSILKPSEEDPSASLVVAELLKKADLPDGVSSVLQGDRETAG